MNKRLVPWWLILSLIIGLAFSSAFTWQTQEPNEPVIRVTQVDTSHFPTITVYISVTDSFGNPLGVDPSRLVLRENGEAMTAVQVSAGGQLGSVTTMLVMDVSGSMATNGKLDGAKQAALAYIDHMRPGDQASVMSYNTEVDLVLPITSDKDQLRSAVESLSAGGDTAMFDATLQAEYALEAMQGRKAILLLTDGLDNHSHASAQDVLDAIDAGGLSISIVGLGNSNLSQTDLGSLDEDTLQYLAENAGGIYSFQADPQGLEELYTQLGQALQSELAVTYISPSVLHDGLRRELTVDLLPVGSDAGTVQASASYNPGGLIPEVPNRYNWGLFVGLMAALLVLLVLPRLVPWALAMTRSRRVHEAVKKPKQSRIKLK